MNTSPPSESDRHWRLPKYVSAALVCLPLLCALAATRNDTPSAALASTGGTTSEVIRYRETEASGSVADLQRRLLASETQLEHRANTGYLISLLDQLNISQASQLLVFSKTSCQRDKISPNTPRAIYFNDQAYVAWVPGSTLLEVSCADPKLGAVFYTVNQNERSKPELVRRDQCLECHTSNQTLGIPGYLVRSYATDSNGVIDITDGWSMVDHRTPLTNRWGGWFVRGPLGVYSPEASSPGQRAKLTFNPQADLSGYPQTTSDLVALMVLEHQAHMQNLITRLNYASREHADTAPDKALCEDFLRYLLFIDEAALERPLRGSTAFTSWFEGQGPKDKLGRSLRQFDLQKRLFKFPCSYMIHSTAFDQLPRPARLHLYHRLWKILNGEDSDPAYAAIPAPTRRAVLEILTETKADIPLFWKLD